ncbi:heavy metal translocating P-type ATPase [Opitutus terrae]|uniref:Copper-exporting ATPase n=1 Tax=Opitutus terrae (strain DSM 11246 / JCM 15787 / PB90-1) TaxID=452637 RepID=B2A020_OPITP|nr:heavy metal translocating P-type ATPase metal-binding domain-containing protein [Opitutus terrae]ACB77356.1 Copper-exporting ATPase [Opitutus terrae PB90-1]
MSSGTIDGAAAPPPRPNAPRRPAKPTCAHCGAPLVDVRMQESGFCCSGCAYVYRLVHEHGLAGYYNIKDEITAPADDSVFEPRDFSWLASAQREAEAAAGAATPSSRPTPLPPELTLDVQGISCAGCVWLIEKVFAQQPGARDIEANAQLGQLQIRWIPPKFSVVEFARKLQSFGYLLGPAGDTGGVPESRGLVKRIGLCAAFAMNVMLFAFPAYFGMEPSFEYARLFGLLTLAFGTLSFLVGGVYFVGRAFRALREGAMHIDLPIALGILGAYGGSLYGWFAREERFVYFDFVATFILLMLVGRWAQVAAVERNQRRLLSQQPKPQRVALVVGGELPPEQLQAGQDYFAAAGQVVPVESRLISAEAAFSLASITGEPEPRSFLAGQRVPAGAINVSRTRAELSATQPWADSLLAQLLQPHVRAGARHALLEAIVRGYLIAIIVLAVGAGIAWWMISHDALRTWSVVTAVLVVSCPCAIGLAFPLADEIATVALRRRGVFVRNGDLWPRLGRVRKLVFDKTGTLTLEMPVLLNPDALRSLDAEARSALHALVRDNPHPVSQCLLANLLSLPSFGSEKSNPLGYSSTDAFPEIRETISQGVEFVQRGHRWSLGRVGWRSPVAVEERDEEKSNPLGYSSSRGYDTELAVDGHMLARFQFADMARPDARAEIAALQAAGAAVFILSGDRPEKVSALAKELGLPAAHALGHLTPQEKATWIEAHGRDETLMLGDGANDSLAFDQALCRGTPVIHRGILAPKSDFYYLGRGIAGVRALFAVNALRRRTQIIILLFSVLYNALAVGLALAGHMNPLVAAILMPANSLLTLALVTGGMRRAFAR